MQGSATTPLDVLNLALSALGKDHCDSFEPNLGIEPESLEGKKLARLFSKAIDDVQRGFYWHELITSQWIEASLSDHHDGRKRYALPQSCIRPLGVRVEGTGGLTASAYTKLVAQDSENDYDVAGNYLLTHASSESAIEIGGSNDAAKGYYFPSGTVGERESFTKSGGELGADSVFWDTVNEAWIISAGNAPIYASFENVTSPDLAFVWVAVAAGEIFNPADWILVDGTWNDSGIWVNSAVWGAEVVPALGVKKRTAAVIDYIKRSADPADWTSELLDCIVIKLAADAALAVTGEYRLAQALKDDYRHTIRADAKRLQSKYKTNETRMPRGFGAWRANRG